MTMVVRWTITCLVVTTTACFSKPDRPELPDAVIDAAPQGGSPRVVGEVHGNNTNALTMTLTMTVPQRADQLLVAGVHVGADCEETVPSVLAITVGSQQLAPLVNLVGTPCGMGSRSEVRTLLAPPAGTVDVNFVLDGPAVTFHAFAILVENVHTDPIRTFAMADGEGSESAVSIDSAKEDLVIDTIAHGSGINAPGANQTAVFQNNASNNTTLDNSGASRRRGDTAVAMTWEFGSSDQWHAIALSIRPQ